MTSGNSEFMSPQEIYEKITSGDKGKSLGIEHSETRQEQRLEQERTDMVLSLAKAIREGWQGEASEGAYGTAMPLAERMIGNTLNLKHAENLLAGQMDSFQTVYHSVRPISDPPKGSVDEPFPFDVDHEIEVKKYQDDAQNNIHAYRVYDEASHHNEINMPKEYLAGDRDGGEVSVGVDRGDVIKVDDPGPASGDPRPEGPRPGGPGPGGSFPDSRYRGPLPGDGGGGAPGPRPGGTQTSPSDFRPSSPVGFTYPAPGQPSPVSGDPGVPVGGYSGGGEFGPRGSGAGGGPGVGGGGPRGAGGAGGVRGPGAGVRGPGGGVGAGALAAEEAAARRAAQAAAARPGTGPMGMPAGAGRGKGDEDDEHRRKVLMESDGEAVFGSDVLTAPQVIGDDEYED